MREGVKNVQISSYTMSKFRDVTYSMLTITAILVPCCLSEAPQRDLKSLSPRKNNCNYVGRLMLKKNLLE